MSTPVTNLYNTLPQSRRLGLTRRYSNRLHTNIPVQRKSTEQNKLAATEGEDNNICAPPESSSDEESGGEGTRRLNKDQDSRSAPEEGKAPLQTGFPSKRGLSTVNAKTESFGSKKARNYHDKIDEREEGVFAERKIRKSKSYGSKQTAKKAKAVNLHTSRQRSRPQKPAQEHNDTSESSKGFIVPGGLNALDQLSKQDSHAAFKIPLDANTPGSRTGEANGPIFKEPIVASRKAQFVRPRESLDGPQFILPPERASSTGKHCNGQKSKVSKTKTRRKQKDESLSAELLKLSQDPRLGSDLPKLSQEYVHSMKSSASSSPLSSPRSKDYGFESSATTVPFAPLSPQSSGPECPMCHQPIPPDSLPNFISDVLQSSAKRLTVGQQVHFCRHHRTLEAKDKWILAGYPDIDWHSFHARLEPLKTHIDSIINCHVPSFYRQRVRDLDKEQRARGGRQTIQNELDDQGDGAELLGYYGTRGRRAVEEFIMANFKRKMKGLRNRDLDLIRCGGMGRFVQSVLVPEVIQQLVEEDLKNTNGGTAVEHIDQMARKIMDESKDLGRLLCEEEEDEIESQSDGETGYGE